MVIRLLQDSSMSVGFHPGATFAGFAWSHPDGEPAW
jgi:hypothetical protein